MRLTLHGFARTEAGSGDVHLELGAAVVRQRPGGGVELEFGPADGPPQLRVQLGQADAQRLGTAIHTVATTGGETVIIPEN